jgi:hypothetical protein
VAQAIADEPQDATSFKTLKEGSTTKGIRDIPSPGGGLPLVEDRQLFPNVHEDHLVVPVLVFLTG